MIGRFVGPPPVLGLGQVEEALDTQARNATGNITQLLVAWGNGDQAALGALAPHIQGELHRLALHYMAGERPGHVLQATALVNEAYLRLVDWQHVEWKNRAHFFGVAAQMMRRILVDFARSRDRVKRGGQALEVSLSEAANASDTEKVDVIALDEALKSLEELDPRQSRVIELRDFGGLSLEETAEALRVSVATVRRDWTLARAWLFRELSRKGAG
ncbi:MAG TPA: sigma-70 family RNA polymerase sigma factor [Bryobacteraceae bacterium]|nr:sigma-70 family RNA polymerase sigma factor [Bryobacteraceae bacterium]